MVKNGRHSDKLSPREIFLSSVILLGSLTVVFICVLIIKTVQSLAL